MNSDAEAIDHLEESKKRLQRELEEKSVHLEEKIAQMDKVRLKYVFQLHQSCTWIVFDWVGKKLRRFFPSQLLFASETLVNTVFRCLCQAE